jgi:hypothetical protein
VRWRVSWQSQAPPETKNEKPTPLLAGLHVVTRFFDATIRLMRYAQITINALEDYKARGHEHLEPPKDTSLEESFKLLAIVHRKQDVDFLKDVKEHAETLVFGQAVISLWGAFESCINDLLGAAVTSDPSPIKALSPKYRLAVADIFTLDEDERVEQVIEMVRLEVRSGLQRGVGVFEPLLKVFGLGGAVAEATSREILEFSAVRNCLAHRRGIVDKRFLDACGTTTLKLGDLINVTARDADCYFYAAWQYVMTILARVAARWDPESDFAAKQAASMLASLQAARDRASHAKPAAPNAT